mmetsp:Transcript_15224/g.24671  ORF Transcript_15224/g.24671 Transcript_15224/m.24671 type:complete len:127 (-) Transcript_15224:1003-1383(-)
MYTLQNAIGSIPIVIHLFLSCRRLRSRIASYITEENAYFLSSRLYVHFRPIPMHILVLLQEAPTGCPDFEQNFFDDVDSLLFCGRNVLIDFRHDDSSHGYVTNVVHLWFTTSKQYIVQAGTFYPRE